MTLDNLQLNKIAKIIKIDNDNNNIKRRLLDLGITPGTCIKAILKSPSGSPRAYEVRGALIAIRNDDAKKIIIQ